MSLTIYLLQTLPFLVTLYILEWDYDTALSKAMNLKGCFELPTHNEIQRASRHRSLFSRKKHQFISDSSLL